LRTFSIRPNPDSFATRRAPCQISHRSSGCSWFDEANGLFVVLGVEPLGKVRMPDAVQAIIAVGL
jgi:hypothetical protein